MKIVSGREITVTMVMSLIICSVATVSLPIPTNAQVNIGGKVIYTWPFPCYSPSFGFWSITLQPIPTAPPAIPVTYPYLPPVITKSWLLPGVVGVTTLGNGPPGACKTVIPCPTGLCPFILPSGSVPIQYGSAINTGLGL